MPSGNIQRTLHNFVSTVANMNDGSNNETPARVVSRRTVANGSWLMNDIITPSTQQQFLHPNQSVDGNLDTNYIDSSRRVPSQTISPRSVQLDQNSSNSVDFMDNYIETEFLSAYTSNHRPDNSSNFNVTELESPSGVPLQQLQQILRGNMVNATTNRATVNNSLRNKIVYKLTCTYCKIPVCNRAMRAILLADTKIELYSTDIPPKAVVTMNEDRMTSGCNCRIRDTVCSGCGNVLGYHVSQPCDKCLEARNNGHFWMFCSDGVKPSERVHFDGNGPLYWAALSPMCDFVPASEFISSGSQAGNNSAYDSFCR